MDYEYDAYVVFTAYGAEVKMKIPYLDVEPTESLLRDILIEEFFENIEIKSFSYITKPMVWEE